MEIRLPAALHGPGLEFAQVVTGLVAEQSDQEGAVPGKPARIHIGLVVELLDGLQNPVPGLHMHPGLVIQHPRDGFCGNFRQVGDFLNSDGPGRWRHEGRQVRLMGWHALFCAFAAVLSSRCSSIGPWSVFESYPPKSSETPMCPLCITAGTL